MPFGEGFLVETLLFNLVECVKEFDGRSFDFYFHFAGLIIIRVEEGF